MDPNYNDQLDDPATPLSHAPNTTLPRPALNTVDRQTGSSAHRPVDVDLSPRRGVHYRLLERAQARGDPTPPPAKKSKAKEEKENKKTPSKPRWILPMPSTEEQHRKNARTALKQERADSRRAQALQHQHVMQYGVINAPQLQQNFNMPGANVQFQGQTQRSMPPQPPPAAQQLHRQIETSAPWRSSYAQSPSSQQPTMPPPQSPTQFQHSRHAGMMPYRPVPRHNGIPPRQGPFDQSQRPPQVDVPAQQPQAQELPSRQTEMGPRHPIPHQNGFPPEQGPYDQSQRPSQRWRPPQQLPELQPLYMSMGMMPGQPYLSPYGFSPQYLPAPPAPMMPQQTYGNQHTISTASQPFVQSEQRQQALEQQMLMEMQQPALQAPMTVPQLYGSQQPISAPPQVTVQPEQQQQAFGQQMPTEMQRHFLPELDNVFNFDPYLSFDLEDIEGMNAFVSSLP